VLELLDRVLHTGVVLVGDVTISVADIELVYLRLQLLLCSAETAQQAGWLPRPAALGTTKGGLLTGKARVATPGLAAPQQRRQGIRRCQIGERSFRTIGSCGRTRQPRRAGRGCRRRFGWSPKMSATAWYDWC